MILLDTNVVSELMRPAPDAAVQRWFAGLGADTLATTSICLSEIVYGLSRLPHGQRRIALFEKLEIFVGPDSGLPVLALDDAAARESGRLRAMKEAMGKAAASSDMMIAGIVLAMGAALATRNVRDFDGLGLNLINPWSE